MKNLPTLASSNFSSPFFSTASYKYTQLHTLADIFQIPNLHLSDDVPGGTEDSRLHYLGAPGEPGAGAEP